MARGKGYPIQGDVGILGSSVSSGELDANSVGSSELIDNAVINSKILDGAVSTSKLAASSVIATKIASRVITADKIVTGTITANEIASGAVSTTKIAGRAVNASRIATGTITNNEVASGTLDDSRISGQVGLDKGGTNQDFSTLSGESGKTIKVNSGETALALEYPLNESAEQTTTFDHDTVDRTPTANDGNGEIWTVDSNYKYVKVTEVSWKNGATVDGNTMVYFAISPNGLRTDSDLLIIGQTVPVANSGTDSLQTAPLVNPIWVAGGTKVHIIITTDSATQTYRRDNANSGNNKEFTYTTTPAPYISSSGNANWDAFHKVLKWVGYR